MLDNDGRLGAMSQGSDGKAKAGADNRAPHRPDAPLPGSGPLPTAARSAPPSRAASEGDVADFVRRVKELGPGTVAGRGRLMFAMDAIIHF